MIYKEASSIFDMAFDIIGDIAVVEEDVDEKKTSRSSGKLTPT